MKIKKTLCIGAATCAAISAASAGVLFIWPSLMQHVPFSTSLSQPTHEEPTRETDTTKHSVPSEKIENGRGGEQVQSNDHGAPAAKKNDEVELLAATDYVTPGSRTSPIVQAMREITQSQSSMANGDEEISPQLKMLMLRMPLLLNAAEPETNSQWEIEAIALYVLSGGDPTNTLAILKSEKLSAEQRSLLEGVTSYSKAEFSVAAEKLLPLEVQHFESFLAAQLAITQAQLETPLNSGKSIQKLAFAANLVPGSLVEEAAIRRILPHLARHGDSQKFTYWAQRYLRRFPNSLYYSDFEQSFMLAISTLSKKKLVVDENELAKIFQIAGKKRTLPLARQILMTAIQTADTAACKHTSEAIELTYKIDDLGFEDLSALVRICQVVENIEAGPSALKQIDSSKLDTTVKRQLDQAITMAAAILANSALEDISSFGPNLPLSASVDYEALLASVAQQLAGSLAVINRVDDDETSY